MIVESTEAQIKHESPNIANAVLGAVLLTNSNKMSDIIKQAQMEQDVKTRTAVFQMFKSGDDISVSLIQRKCKVGYNSASRTFENLVEDGLIEKGNGNGVSKFL